MTLFDVLSVFDCVQFGDWRLTASSDLVSSSNKFASLLWLLPRLARSRYYSIASSPLTSPRELRIIFNVLELDADVPYRQRPLKGVCTGFLERLIVASETGTANANASRVHLFFRSSPPPPPAVSSGSAPAHPSKTPVLYRAPFRVPPTSELQRPLVCVATGTGLVPFLGFLEHRCEQLRRALVRYDEDEVEYDEERGGLLVGPVLVLFGCRTLAT